MLTIFLERSRQLFGFIYCRLSFSLSNEQLIACVIGVVLVYHGIIFFKRRKENYYLLLPTSLFIGGAAFMLLAPGNELRLQQEVKMWMPDFYKMSSFSKVLRGSSWLFEGWQTKLLLLFIIIFIVSVLIDSTKMLAKVTGAYIVFLILLIYTFPNRFTNFQLITKIDLLSQLKSGHVFNLSLWNAVLPFMLWGVFFGLIIAYSLSVAEKSLFRIKLFCCTFFIDAYVVFTYDVCFWK
ncbi:hypothetical protein GQR36_10580 [Enterococcus termitis]